MANSFLGRYRRLRLPLQRFSTAPGLPAQTCLAPGTLGPNPFNSPRL
jgi:hypothetical protein